MGGELEVEGLALPETTVSRKKTPFQTANSIPQEPVLHGVL
jgi:hypothetical protein